MQELNLLSTELSGLNLIEASAGTGKTFTITGLYLRLVLEMGCQVDGLLVVTFTNAATAELRERTRGRLVEALQAFELGASSDPFYQGLLAQCPDHEQAQRRLRLAILGFDQAAIFTIHGFYQRVLSEHAFESGMPFDSELVSEQTELLQEIVADFWRREVQDLPPGLVGFLLTKNVTPQSLLSSVQQGIGKPYLDVRGAKLPADLTSQEQAFQQAFDQARSIWRDAKHDIQELLQADTSLNGNKYRKSSLVNWIQQMDEYLGLQPGAPFDKFIKFTTSELAASVKKDKAPPKHAFFDACVQLTEIWSTLEPCYAQALVALKQNLLAYCNQELSIRKAKARIQSFDDLLLDLDRALSSERGPVLVEAIRQRYSAVLIDEFQDTDPIQYKIFSRITDNSELPVFLVGDPKQAIYSFRGADIFAYHHAREDAKNRYTLKTNWRSDPKLINAVNALFKQSHASFFYDWIPFYEVAAAEKKRDELRDVEGVEAPFRVWVMEGEAIAKANAEQLATRATAAEIARLLQQGQRVEAHIGDRNLSGGDIAVLVREHRQAKIIAQQLRELGVYSVQQSRENIFHSREAVELLYVLCAVAEPIKQARILTALATDMMGLDAHDIEQLQIDEQALELQLESFRSYHQLWQELGFVRMFSHLLSHERVAKRLLSRVDGERRYTNLQHLGELLHQYDSTAQAGMEGLIKWLSRQCQNSGQTSEEQELRLESDEDLVQIITIHKSKGLEYPIVFCPFLWADRIYAENKTRPYSFHDERQNYQPVLELGSERFEEDRQFAIQEERAENLRLLYVALTRAQHRCYITWGNISGVEQSALAWLLNSPAKSTVETNDVQTQLNEWLKKSDGGLWIGPIPEEEGTAIESRANQGEPGSVCQFTRRFDMRSRVTSFTALTSGHAGDQPDYDAQQPALIERVATHDIFSFPRGARAGCCIHSIFEQIDFATYERAKLESLIEEALQANGFESDWMPVIANMVEAVLTTPLDSAETLYLKSVGAKQRLVELEFHFPLAAIDAEGLRNILLEHEFSSEPVMQQAIERINFADVSGFMKGFIDLIFEVDGCFYLADYKSNWLGDGQSAYAGNNLTQVMAHETYYLQYLLYTLALHRYLSLRLPNYDYDQHFGGAFYLFVRGMNPAAGSGCGVYWDKPAKQLIEAMDHYLIVQ